MTSTSSEACIGATKTQKRSYLGVKDAPRESNISGESVVDLLCSLKNMKYIKTLKEIRKVSDELKYMLLYAL